MRIGFVSHTDPGHINPISTLARHLKRRGHDVVLLATPDGAPYAQAAGLPHVVFGERILPLGSVRERHSIQSRLQGEEAAIFAAESLGQVCDALYEDLPGLLRRLAFDGVVMDPIHVGTGVIPASLGVPYVHASCALHYDLSGQTPLFLYDWPHGTSAEDRARNRAGVDAIRPAILDPLYAKAKRYADANGVTVDFADPFATLSPLAILTQVPQEFDFAGVSWPRQFHFTGPFSDGAGRIAAPFPWESLDGKPIIYASLGTLQNGVDQIFKTIGRAASRFPQYQLVVSLGAVLTPESIGTFPANAIVLPSVPQVEILKRATLCITHAGLNTTLEALAQGVPLVALPITNDQPGVASRIHHSGVGETIAAADLTDAALEQAIRKVLSNPDYAAAASRMRLAIQKTDGITLAADYIESAFKTEPPLEGPGSSSTDFGLKIVPPGKGEEFDVAGVRLTWKAKGQQTDYAFSLCEQPLEEGEGVPLHSHPYAETFYVLDGPISFFDGSAGVQAWADCETGTTVTIPANTVHGFRNTTSGQRRLLGVSTYLHQLFFDAVRDAAAKGEFDRCEPAQVMQLVAQIGASQKMFFLPPPPDTQVSANTGAHGE